MKTYRFGTTVWLMPHNPAFEPIPGDEAITGKVVAVCAASDPVDSPPARAAPPRHGRFYSTAPRHGR